MTRYAEHASKRQTPQSEQADPAQQENNAGGFSFVIDDWGRLQRFLILGAEGGTYYVKERKLTRENAACIDRCLDANGPRTVEIIATVSESGRAPKNDPAVFALALAASHKDPVTRRLALAALPRVCRIGTHLFQFAESVQHFRGWGRMLRRAIGSWYTDKTPDEAAYQIVKYRQRGGWSHRDLLRLCHVRSDDKAQGALLRFAVGAGLGPREVSRDKVVKSYAGFNGGMPLPQIVDGFVLAQEAASPVETAKLVRGYRLTREMVQTDHLGDSDVWAALLAQMPMGAMLRNLGKMSAVGLLKPMTDASRLVSVRLRDAERIKKARLHPLAILVAQRVYAQGKGIKGSLTWEPVGSVIDALNDAFYLAFDTVEPTGKNTMLALDVSGSMSCGAIAGTPLTPREASAAMALVTARTEQNYHIVGFTSGQRGGGGWGQGGAISALPITPAQRLDDAIEAVSGLSFGGTDCALPMIHALEKGLEIDTFVIYTDSETWAGNMHPHEALQRYRQATGRNAKLIVVGMTSTEFTIADPNDAGMLDVVGWDTATPSLMADFAR